MFGSIQRDISPGSKVTSSPKRTAASRAAPFTVLQGQYLSFIHTYEGIHGCAPAEADLQRHFAVTPPSVHQMILTLERKGLITRVAGAARSIKLQIAPTALPPLEHRDQSAPDRQGSQLGAIRSRHAADQAKRKSSTRVLAKRIAKPDAAAEYVDSPMMTKRLRLGTIGKIVVAFPQTLGLFSVAGFDETDDDGDDDLGLRD